MTAVAWIVAGVVVAWVSWEALTSLARRQRCKDVVAEHEKRKSVIDSVERRVAGS